MIEHETLFDQDDCYALVKIKEVIDYLRLNDLIKYDNTCNGYKNLETYHASLVLDSNENTYRLIKDNAERLWKDYHDKAIVVSLLGDWMKDNFYPYETIKNDPLHLYKELLELAYDLVNWYEIAENYIDEVLEDEI